MPSRYAIPLVQLGMQPGLELREGGVEVGARDELAGGVRAGLAGNVNHGHGERLGGAGGNGRSRIYRAR